MIIGCFRSFNIVHPHSGSIAEVDYALACALTALFQQIHSLGLETPGGFFSATSVLLWMALFLLLLLSAVVPSSVKALQRDCPDFHKQEPCLPTLLTRPLFFSFFSLKNLSILWSFYGMISSSMKHFWLHLTPEQSGLREVLATC